MKKMYYEICSCNPVNGGNGICGCTIGNRLVDIDNTYTTTITTTSTLFDKIKPQMKQTAVEWLTDQLGIDGGTMRDKALAMEKEQNEDNMVKAITFGWELSHYYRDKEPEVLLKMQKDFITSVIEGGDK